MTQTGLDVSAEEQRAVGSEVETGAAQGGQCEGHRQGCEIWEAGTQKTDTITLRTMTLGGRVVAKDFQKAST